MKVIICKDKAEVAAKAYENLKPVITENATPILGLATGSSPIGLYQNMIEDYKLGNVSYENVRTVNLDEYVGLDKNHPESYYSFMHHNLFDHINIKESNINLPVGDTTDLAAAATAYEKILRELVADVQILGIGSNGHIGFNEPGTPFDEEVHIIDLAENTIKDNARFFDNDIKQVPTQAITMGIADIMRAKKIILVAMGENKAKAIYETVNGKITTDVPSTILQQHNDVTIIVDEAAASLLKKA